MFHRHTFTSALRAFEAAARLNSFKNAADELNISPTAISHQIRGLEGKLGTKLFIRGTRTIALTPEGEKLVTTVHAAFLQISNTIEEITDDLAKLSICSPESFAAMWIVPRLEEFKQLHPNISIDIKTGDYCPDFNHDLRVDFGIRYTADVNVYDYEKILAHECLGLFASPAYLNKVNELDTLKVAQVKSSSDYFSTKDINSIDKFKNKLIDIISVEKEHHALQLALTGQALAAINTHLASYYVDQNLILDSIIEPVPTGASYRLYIPDSSTNLQKVRLFEQWLSTNISLK